MCLILVGTTTTTLHQPRAMAPTHNNDYNRPNCYQKRLASSYHWNHNRRPHYKTDIIGRVVKVKNEQGNSLTLCVKDCVFWYHHLMQQFCTIFYWKKVQYDSKNKRKRAVSFGSCGFLRQNLSFPWKLPVCAVGSSWDTFVGNFDRYFSLEGRTYRRSTYERVA